MDYKVKKITLTRAEGLTSLCGIPYTVPTFDLAESILAQMVVSDEPNGIDKVDWVIETECGEKFTGTYYLKKDRQGFLEQHIERAKFNIEYLNNDTSKQLYGLLGTKEKQAGIQLWIDTLEGWKLS
jgi:hypothetical protein